MDVEETMDIPKGTIYTPGMARRGEVKPLDEKRPGPGTHQHKNFVGDGPKHTIGEKKEPKEERDMMPLFCFKSES